jgi:nitrite reductase/ring-hydroxylating ferredoxin subunit
VPVEPLTRRGALVGTAVAGAAAVVGFLLARGSRAATGGTAGAANEYGPEPASGVLLAALADVPEGGGVVLPEQRVVLVRTPDGQVRGWSAVCTHQGCLVTAVRDGVIVCPCHATEFDAASGAVLAGPAGAPLPEVAVEVRGDGIHTR